MSNQPWNKAEPQPPHRNDDPERPEYARGGYGGGYGGRDYGNFGLTAPGFGERRGWAAHPDDVRLAGGYRDPERYGQHPAAPWPDYRGVGPRGYERSDARIHEDISDRMMLDSNLDAGDIAVSVKDREVTLDGTVADRWAKRLAEDLADSVVGVDHVQNNLRVRPR